jgi:pilus assembly protein CpaB
MNKRLLTILLLAFVIAGACAFLVYKAVGNRMGGGTPSSTRVVAAAADIKIGSLLTAQSLTTMDIAGAVPKGAILDPKNAINRGVLSDIYQGEPILESRLAPPGGGAGLAATIPEGMRAMAVKVDDVVGVSGFATPGMHVDVLASVPIRVIANVQSQQDNTVVKTILQNIQVLSAGAVITKDPEGKAQSVQVVNLLVNPDQAETLSLASTGANGTKIQLVLRNPLDTDTKDVKENSVGTIFAGTNIAQPAAHAVARRTATKTTPPAGHISIEVINGSKRTEEKFSTPEAKQ